MEQAPGLGLYPPMGLLASGTSAPALLVFQALPTSRGCSWVQLSLG